MWRIGETFKYERPGMMDPLYRKVSQLTNRKRKKQNVCVRHKEDNMVTDCGKVQEHLQGGWK